jgi:tRNA(adenine34) deaminase
MMTATSDDERYMRRAIALAESTKGKRGASPIGCIIVLDGAIVGEGHNEVGMRPDPTAHAEMVSIGRAARHLATIELRGATLYSTLQPCGMCSLASVWARISRIVYGAGREDVHSMYFDERHLDTVDFIADAYAERISVQGGVLRAQCAALYYRPVDDVPEDEQANR